MGDGGVYLSSQLNFLLEKKDVPARREASSGEFTTQESLLQKLPASLKLYSLLLFIQPIVPHL